MSAASDTKRRGNTTIAEPIMLENPDDPLEVELYVCESCRKMSIKTVGKLPQGRGSRYHAMCTGPPGHDHKQAAMKPKPFREMME